MPKFSKQQFFMKETTCSILEHAVGAELVKLKKRGWTMWKHRDKAIDAVMEGDAEMTDRLQGHVSYLQEFKPTATINEAHHEKVCENNKHSQITTRGFIGAVSRRPQGRHIHSFF
jgi:hypothetical protein